METEHKRPMIDRVGRPAALGLSLLAGLITQAYAQETAEPIQTVVVKSYRDSLQTSANDKRKSTGFQDSVFAEDIGKFPDANIAESLSRIPGVQVARDITGEGVNIKIRGLGSSFTRVLLNGAPIAVATPGDMNGVNNNREVDLDMLPTDLFSKLTVSKSPNASLIEGGSAGVVDMRSARPFDNPGKYVALSLDGKYNSAAKRPSDRGSVIASQTFGDTFGILAGLSWSRTKINPTGFESVYWTNPNLSAAQSSSPNRNNTGGNGWVIPATVPANAGNGLKPGDVINQKFLLDHNPGLTIDQIDNALIPRLARPMSATGSKNRISGIVSAEFRPSKELQFYLDTVYSVKKSDLIRSDMNWVVRSGAVIPLNMTVDRSDCSNGCVATGGTFANAQNFLEWRPIEEEAYLFGVNPGMQWKLSDKLTVNAQLNLTKSRYDKSAPTVLPSTVVGGGNTVTYTNNGWIPVATSSVDLNNPANFGWAGGRVNTEDAIRRVSTKGARTDIAWGDSSFNVKVGVAWDESMRRTSNYENSAEWQAAACGNNPSPWLQAPNKQPVCDGASTPGASTAALWPGYGQGYTAGTTGAPKYLGSLIPAANLSSYLRPGPDGVVSVDWDRFSKDSHYADYHKTDEETNSSGYIRERVTGFFTEVNGQIPVAGYGLRYNGGLRYVRTNQVVGAVNVTPDARTSLPMGAKYPDARAWVYQESTYHNTLPSASLALDLSKSLVARASASRTMTRASPAAMRPGFSFSSVTADQGTIPNPALAPYLSDNLDLGMEWYTGREGYVSATVFHKKLSGFTVTDNLTRPFTDLAQYGVTYDTLTQTQQAAINARGGPNVSTVVLQNTRNSRAKLVVDGVELGWVQPLDKWLPVKGFGLNENFTYVRQGYEGQDSTGLLALGVPKRSNNFTVYYERNGYMARLSHAYSAGYQTSGLNQQGVIAAALYKDAYKQLDFSASFDLDRILDKTGWPTITVDVTNLGNSVQRDYMQFTNATYTEYEPGRTFGIGLRKKF